MASRSNILITGCHGQLGNDLMNILSSTYDVTGVDIDTVDITNPSAVTACLESNKPDVVVHAAAFTDVDACESQQDLAMAVNAEGTRNVAAACRQVGARLVYYSTDYVFDGTKTTAYVESDPPSPCTIYGKSKLAGEKAVCELLDDYAILRIAWVYGASGKNFVKAMLRLGRQQLKSADGGDHARPLKVVDDQIGNPTWTVDIVRQTGIIIERRLQGLFHSTSEGQCSWFGFASRMFKLQNMPVVIESCTTEQFPRPAPRPKMSALENNRLKRIGDNTMRNWEEALEEFLSGYSEILV